MSEIDTESIKDIFESFEHELFYQNLVKMGSIKDIKLGFPCASIATDLATSIVKDLQQDDRIDQAEASGKGGVGKSTAAANLVLVLQAEGA